MRKSLYVPIRQNLTSTDVRFWRMRTVSALKGLTRIWRLLPYPSDHNTLGQCIVFPGIWQICVYSGSRSHTTRRGRASCSLWYAPVANVCDLLLCLDENRVILEFRHFWKVTSRDEELFTVLYFPSNTFPMTWPRKLFTGLNSTGMKVTWLRTLASTRP